MVENASDTGGVGDGGQGNDTSGGGVSGPDQARDSMNSARDESSRSQESRDATSGMGGVLSDAAGHVGGDNDNHAPGRGEGSMDAAAGHTGGDHDNDSPGRGEGSMDAAAGYTSDTDDRDDDDDDDNRPGPNEGSMDAAAASSQRSAAEREAARSQERMQAEAEIARESFARREQAIAANQEIVTRERGQSYADGLLEANRHEITSNRAHDYGTEYTYYDAEAIAADLVAQSRVDPAATEAAYEAAIVGIGQHGGNLVAAVDRMLDRERVATQTLMGDAPYEPQDVATVEARAAEMVAAHTSTGFWSGATSVDVESLSYDLQNLAATDPSLAVGLQGALSRNLDPVQAVDLNRQIAGDRTFVERMELGVENPVDGAIGLAKGAGNLVTGTAELVVDVANLADVGVNNGLGYAFDAVGLDGVAQDFFDTADFYGDAMAARDWSIPYTNDAQAGGGDAALVGELALGVAAVAKAGVRAGMRQADEVLSPGGVTPGMNYTDEVVQNYNYGGLLRGRIGDPPADMFDPHAHHVVFKRGNGVAQQQLVQEAQQIMRNYDIDPIYGEEVLGWAPNRITGQHSIDALQPVVNRLRMEAELGASREDIVRALEEFRDIAANRGN